MIGRAWERPEARLRSAGKVHDVVFDIDDQQVELSADEATLVAEKLRGCAAGTCPGAVDELAQSGTDPTWLDGARAMADAIEDALTETREGPIPLDRPGLAAMALVQALRLTPITFADATNRYARLYATLTGSAPAAPADVPGLTPPVRRPAP